MKPRRLHRETIFSINSLDFGSAIGGVSFLQATLHVKGTGGRDLPAPRRRDSHIAFLSPIQSPPDTPILQHSISHTGSKPRLALRLGVSAVNPSTLIPQNPQPT